jgi:hypothetical protein
VETCILLGHDVSNGFAFDVLNVEKFVISIFTMKFTES